MKDLNVADGQLTDLGLEHVLLALGSKKPLLGPRQPAAPTTLRAAATPRTAPLPLNYNAAIRTAHGMPAAAPTVYLPQTGHGIPRPTTAAYNAAVRVAAQGTHGGPPSLGAPESRRAAQMPLAPATRHASTPAHGAPPPPDFNAAVLRKAAK